MRKALSIISIFQMCCGIICIVYGFLYLNGAMVMDNTTMATYSWCLGAMAMVDAFRK
jgi:hypothetical protein